MQPTTSQDALSQLQQAQAGNQSASDILNSQRQQQGVNAAQDTVQGLRGAITNTTKLLNQVAPSVMGRTASSLVTNAQATRQIANEQQPISQELGQQGQDYNTALGDYNRANSQATEAANMAYGDQQNKMSYLQNLYSSLYGREQDAAKMAEQQRQFNASQALEQQKLTASQSANSGLAGLFGGGNSNPTPATPAASIVQNGSSFNFKDAQGKPINAAQYAQLTNTGYRDLLAKMATEGDKNAQAALNYVGNDFKFGNAPEELKGALGALGATGNYTSLGYVGNPNQGRA